MICRMSKLRPDEIKAIRRKRAQGCGVRQIAHATQRSPSTVSRLLNGETHAKPKLVLPSFEEMGIRATGPSECPNCAAIVHYRSAAGICINCELRVRERQGLIDLGASDVA